MKNLTKSALMAGFVIAATIAQPALAKDKKDKEAAAAAPAPAAAAPVVGGQAIQGIAVADIETAAQNSEAYRIAAQQRPVTYKSSYDAAQARGNALDAQIKPLIDKFNADRSAPKPNVPLLQQQAKTIQDLQERGKQEIQQALLPAALSEAYVNEQIGDKVDQAIQQAMTKNRVTLLLQPGAVIARSNSYDLTAAVTAELNALLPSAQLVPPQGWEPRELREARARQAAAQGAPAPAAPAPAAPRPATPAGPQPDGR